MKISVYYEVRQAKLTADISVIPGKGICIGGDGGELISWDELGHNGASGARFFRTNPPLLVGNQIQNPLMIEFYNYIFCKYLSAEVPVDELKVAMGKSASSTVYRTFSETKRFGLDALFAVAAALTEVVGVDGITVLFSELHEFVYDMTGGKGAGNYLAILRHPDDLNEDG